MELAIVSFQSGTKCSLDDGQYDFLVGGTL